jgi:hypothetical protein
MPSRLRLLQTFTDQVEQLLARVRVTRVRPLALLALGVLWAGTVSLPRIAATLPLAATDPSIERRLRRWLANPAIRVKTLWRVLLPSLLAGQAGREVTIVFDPTPHADHATLLVLGLLNHHRVLPVSWRVMPVTAWPTSQHHVVATMVAEVAAALPLDCTVTLLADRGLTDAGMIDICHHFGWHYVLRLSVSDRQQNRVRAADLSERWLWDLVTTPGQRLVRVVDVFKKRHWRSVHLTIWWARTATEPWVLLSDRPGGYARVREYRRRMRCEATYEDCKTRGFALDRSRLTKRDRLNRLLVAVVLASWWAEQLGLRVIRHGQRRRYDRADRRDLSVLRLGQAAMHEHLERGPRLPPLPFHRSHHSWRYTWLA